MTEMAGLTAKIPMWRGDEEVSYVVGFTCNNLSDDDDDGLKTPATLGAVPHSIATKNIPRNVQTVWTMMAMVGPIPMTQTAPARPNCGKTEGSVEASATTQQTMMKMASRTPKILVVKMDMTTRKRIPRPNATMKSTTTGRLDRFGRSRLRKHRRGAQGRQLWWRAQCNDGIDNDTDGDVDANDANCFGADDNWKHSK